MGKTTRLAIALGALFGTCLAVTWSWTFTSIGRLDYRAALVAKMASWQSGEIEMTPGARAAANRMTAAMLPVYPDDPQVRFEDRRVPSADGVTVPIRIYTPSTEGPPPFFLDIHGGGWWMGNGFPFHTNMVAFAAQTGAIVISVDYRLAPEHPYPAALEDCEAVLRWMAAEGASLGGDPSRIAVGGGSAGGNLAAALALKMRDEGGPSIAFQYLLVPATDLSGTRDWRSYDETENRYVLTVAGIQSMIEAYVPDAIRRMDPYVSPLLEGDLSGLPPALVVTALFDPLRDQGEAYARRLEDAGVPVALHREPALHGMMASPERGKRVQSMAAEAVREALALRP
jgi:acetyl esterase